MELKSYLIVKQVDKKHQLKEDYVIIQPDKKSVKIHDPYNGQSGLQRIPEQKSGAEFQFKVDKIIEGGLQQSPTVIFKDAFEEIVTNAISNSKNGVIFAYGQTKSGKSSNLFGSKKLSQPGLLQQTVNKFFEIATPTPQSTQNYRNSANGGAQALYLSMFDINFETVRDFGRYMYLQPNQQQICQGYNKTSEFDFHTINQSSLEKQSSELLDNSNEAIQVRGLHRLEIISPSQFDEFINEEQLFRDELDKRHKVNNKKYNQVYILSMKHKMSAQLSHLYFVKIAGSEKVLKGQTTNEQKRVQEQIIANNSLFSLSKYLSGLAKNDQNVSYHESRLTKSLHGILQNDEKNNYEETLLTLQYMDRLKGYDQQYKKVLFDGPMPEQIQAQERLMERIQDENRELKKKYEQQIQEEKEKFDEIKRRLGLEFTVNQLLKAKPNTKENSYLLLHQEATERAQTLNNIHLDLEKKLKNILKKQEDSDLQLQQFQQKCEEQIVLLEKKYDELANKHQNTKGLIRSRVKEENKDINEEISKMIFHGQILMEERAHLIHGLKDELKKTSEHFNKVSELKDMGKREAEMQYKFQLSQMQEEYENSMRNIKEQYSHLISGKDQELRKFIADAEKYTNDKKQEISQARQETVQLFEIIKTQCETIDLVESGAFSNGIKSYNIPKQDKQTFPERDSFKFLFKSLEKTKSLISRGSAVGAGSNAMFMNYTKQKSVANEINNTKFEDTYIQEMEEQLRLQKRLEKVTHSQKHNYHTFQQADTQQHDFEPFRKTRLQDVDVLTLDQLKNFAKALQGEIKRCSQTNPLNPQGIREQTLDGLLKEREKWKQAAVNENKKLMDSQDVLESQKRIIDKSSALGNSFYSQNRPMTQAGADQNQGFRTGVNFGSVGSINKNSMANSIKSFKSNNAMQQQQQNLNINSHAAVSQKSGSGHITKPNVNNISRPSTTSGLVGRQNQRTTVTKK
eukprot:403353010